MKVIPEKLISSCAECNCLEHDDDFNYYCAEKQKRLSSDDIDDTIPSWCPLKDAEDWKDKPDSEGWWWRRYSLGKLSCEFFNDEAVETWDFYNTGKWHKATMPEESQS